MDRDAAIDILRAHEPELQRLGVRHAAVFGSVARGENHAGSDLDVMIEIDARAVRDAFNYVGICRAIGSLFPIPVDVANRETLKPHILSRAERDAVRAF
ncbi:nucleotidyltransferase domain-containing protein [Methylobacterium sp. E-025]|uniref:nucleotidyltransferase family protein n=1 Tax=Methylobacterium sp. E-025 TaxID=2836561 RepID=UPI001FBAF3BB|nr:nucleotidyltransferase domain-containing protein [Methylobacterium sp. E-025]MCJ2112304.1 nucleotidyltransferase domain-containing protein [Methylobacterium sp. E-025]